MPQTVREISPLQRFPLTGIAVALAPPNNAAGIDAASSLVVLDRTLPARSPRPFTAGFGDARSRSEPLSRLPLSPVGYGSLSESPPPGCPSFFDPSRSP
jgi:hypothetical protein